MSECIAVLNAGSSSIKIALYDAGSSETLLYRGQIEQIGVSPRLRIADSNGKSVAQESFARDGFDHPAATRKLLETATKLMRGRNVAAVGHRVVHGGTKYAAPTRVDADIVASLT